MLNELRYAWCLSIFQLYRPIDFGKILIIIPGCPTLSAECPTKCVKLGENGCLICNCLNTTSDSPNIDVFTTNGNYYLSFSLF
jgi:hypothetical protein